jgi:hypothetical protein
LDYLIQAGEPQTQQQIRDAVVGDIRFIRAALTSLTRSGRVARTGDGKRHKPYLYSAIDSGMEDTQKILKPPSQFVPQVRVDTEEKLVCTVPTDADKAGKFIVLPFDYREAAFLIRKASPYKESLAKVQPALHEAALELGEKRGIPKDQAATWILGRVLQYYEREAQEPKAWVKKAVDLLLDGTYADEQACDRSQGSSNGGDHNSVSVTHW